MPITPVGRILRNGGGSQMGHQEEKKGVSRHVQIEIDEAVHQKPATGHEAGKMQRGSKGFIRDQQLLERTEEQEAQERGTAESTNQTGVGQHFKIVVMRMIDYLCVIEAFVGRKDDGKGTQARAGQWMIAKDTPRVVTHRGALAQANFQRLHGGEAFENLAYTEPRNEHEGEEQDHAAGQNMRAPGAT